MTKKKFNSVVRTKYLRKLHRAAMVDETFMADAKKRKPNYVPFKVWVAERGGEILEVLEVQERESFTEKATSLLTVTT